MLVQTPCNISKYLDSSESSIVALFARSVMFFTILHIGRLIPVSHIFGPSFHNVSWASYTCHVVGRGGGEGVPALQARILVIVWQNPLKSRLPYARAPPADKYAPPFSRSAAKQADHIHEQSLAR